MASQRERELTVFRPQDRHISVLFAKWLGFRCDQNGPPARREEWSISEPIRDRRATQPPAHFHRNPTGRGQLAVFRRCSLLTYELTYARYSRLEKQPTDQRRKPSYFANRTLVGSRR